MQLLFNSGSSTPFSTRSDLAGDAIVIEVLGEVDFNTAHDLARALQPGDDSTRRIVVDLSGVTFIDSSGLRTLVEARQERAAQTISFRVVVPPTGHLRRLFELTDLAKALDVVATVEEALRRPN